MSELPLIKGLLLCVVLDAVLSLEKELDFVEKWRGDDGRRFPEEHQVGSGSVAIIKIYLEVGPNALISDLSFIHSPRLERLPKSRAFRGSFPSTKNLISRDKVLLKSQGKQLSVVVTLPE